MADLTLKELAKMCKKKGHKLSGILCKEELFINDEDGKTIYTRYVGTEMAEEICEFLGLELREE